MGAVYFKADNRRPPAEPALVAALARRWPERVPALLAADPARRWMLMRDFGPRLLEGDYDEALAPLAQWEGALRTFARLQLEAAADARRWVALGCADRRPVRLPALLAGLLVDSEALRAAESGGLAPAEADHLGALLPAVRALCTRLAAAGVPDSLVHQDFRGGNVALTARGALFHDWSDAVLGHPFFSGENFVADAHRPVDEATRGPSGVPSLVHYTPAARQRALRDAYLEPWTAVAPPGRLREAFALVQTLAPVWQAVRLHHALPYAETDSPWAVAWARQIPAMLREAIRRLDATP